MPHHPPGRSTVALSFPRAEWDLLVRLPGRVLIAATLVARDRPTHTVAENLAGVEAIAAGRTAPGHLLHDVVAAIYAEQVDDIDPAEFADPRSGIARVLADCRTAVRILERRGATGDAAAYRDWLVDIAAAVCSAARVRGRAAPAEQRFLADLALALIV
ncbi:hypothetical protein ACNTMW_15320 [Planosporangium sp. 12N6]|uniref:hypothetical protein n=1 Tax=Planosporangium spinosum TaxID=3402278 RepID=UPI003CE700B8